MYPLRIYPITILKLVDPTQHSANCTFFHSLTQGLRTLEGNKNQLLLFITREKKQGNSRRSLDDRLSINVVKNITIFCPNR